MKKYLFLLIFSAVGFAQPISQYKYVIVPAKFDAQKSAGQFGLNNLTKLFLEKNGYTVFYDTDILPLEVSGESCNKIYANVFSDNNLRKTKLRVEIKDCRNAVLFVSDYGESIEKDNRVAYNQALRSAFRSFDKPEFRRDPDAIAVNQNDTVVPAADMVKKAEPVSAKANGAVLSAQKIDGGYQLVDTTPKVVMKLYETSQPDVFMAEGDGKKGIVLKKNGQWFFEYRNDSGSVSEPLNIKF